ncbi:MAG: NAD(P)-dependent oxidoreductase [Saprospiraceae bacterium]
MTLGSTGLKVLVTDSVHPILISGLQSRGLTVDYLPDITLEEVKARIHLYSGLIINTKIRVDREMLQFAGKLRVVGRLGSGKEILDLGALAGKGVSVITTPEANCNAVAEHGLGLILALIRHIPRANEEVKKFYWIRESNRGRELSRMRVGVLGYGFTGRRFCHLLSSFGCEVKIHDPYIQFEPEIRSHQKVDHIKDLYDCDVLSLHVSFMPENHHLIGEKIIQSMVRPFYLLNTSRGRVVDLKALASGIDEGKVAGAALDVLENEQIKGWSESENETHQRLVNSGRVIFTPHIAGWTVESKFEIAQSILNQWPDLQ